MIHPKNAELIAANYMREIDAELSREEPNRIYIDLMRARIECLRWEVRCDVLVKALEDMHALLPPAPFLVKKQ